MRCTLSDIEKVKAVLSHQDVAPYIADDAGITPEMCAEMYLQNPACHVLMPSEETCFIVSPFNASTFQVHSAALPEARGRRGVRESKAAVNWFFRNFPNCHKLIGFTPADNRPANVFARLTGFIREGEAVDAIMRDGELKNLVISGITRKAWEASRVKRDILFAFWPLYVEWNHGIALLSSLCKERGLTTDLYILDSLERFRQHIMLNDYGCVGFSCVTVHDYIRALPFMELAKEYGYKVLLGGVFARHGITDKPRFVDHVCKGDGETLPDFLLTGDDALFSGKLSSENLDDLPLPDYDLFKGHPFKRDLPFLEGKTILPYHSSRGCNGSCSFCLVQHQDRRIKVRCRVEEDLTVLKAKYNPDLFFIGDEHIPVENKRWRRSWGDFTHPFACYIRADIEPKYLEWLIYRGMVACAFGIESGDEWYRNEILCKNLKDSDIYRTVNILKYHGIDYVPFYMADTPFVTPEVNARTAMMIERVGGYPMVWQYERLITV